ncbi:hypothetical protein Q3G72_019071 [Acer saccharum]|nr:hypothetical protein Q3G72_019071 [Acer saccharum]
MSIRGRRGVAKATLFCSDSQPENLVGLYELLRRKTIARHRIDCCCVLVNHVSQYAARLQHLQLRMPVLGAFEWSSNNPLPPDLLIMADLTDDTFGLAPFELEALQDCEYKFMSKYVKVGSIKKEEVPVADSESAAEENEGKCSYSI